MADDIIKLYQARLNLQDATFVRIEHEDAFVAEVYKITLSTGKDLILKICSLPRHYFRELYFLNYFAGKLPVPRIVDTVQPEEGIKGAILMECLQGDVLRRADLADSLAFDMGAMLARIHMHRVEGYGDLTKPQALSTDPHEPFIAKFREAMAECAGHLPKALIDQCKRYYDSHLYLLDSVDGPCIVHRDFRPGNVIVYNRKIQGIIDWASAQGGFAEDDLCLMEHGGWAHDSVLRKSFLSGYESVRPVPAYETIMPLLRLNWAIVYLGFTIRTNTWATTNVEFYQNNKRFIENFLGEPFPL